ncbi:MAG TPA: hypothetical protein VM580_28145 [Labilithrix sp.]|nr:hypothetical protein [Labilithrix sp.]
MTLERPYAGAETLYAAASRTAADASRVVFFVRATMDHACAWEEFSDRVPAALHRVQARHRLLRVALGERGFIRSTEPLPYDIVTADDPHAAAIAQLEAEWRLPEEASPFRVRFVLPTAARTGNFHGPMPVTLLVRGHHAACDGFSLVGLASEILRSLCDPSSLPPPSSTAAPPDILTVSRRELGSAWRRPAQASRAVLAYLRRARAVAGPVVQLAPPERATPPLRCLELLLAPPDVERLRARCREHGVGLSAFLTAAAALACESTGRIDIGVAVDLRRLAKATTLPAAVLGFYGAMTDVALAVTPDAEVWRLAAQAADVLKADVQDAPERPFTTALVVSLLLPLVKRTVTAGRSVFSQTLLVSNIGECGPLFDGISGAKVSSAGFASSPRASRKLHVSCTSVRGALSLCVAWPDGTLTTSRVERFASALERTLTAG